MRIFLNSFPKAGLHLMRQVLRPVAEPCPVFPEGVVSWHQHGWGERRNQNFVAAEIQRATDNHLAYGHVAWSHPVGDVLLKGVDHINVLLIRDPRDCAVALKYHVLNPQLRFPGVFREEIKDITPHEDRLKYLDSFVLRFIRGRWDQYRPWLENKDVIVVHYEDLRLHLVDTVDALVQSLEERGWPASGLQQDMINSVFEHGSPTFRKGRVGDHRKEFTQGEGAALDYYLGKISLFLGYE